jgi:hypothetical protein
MWLYQSKNVKFVSLTNKQKKKKRKEQFNYQCMIYFGFFFISEDVTNQTCVKRKRAVKFCDEEIVSMLRSYRVHLCSWIHITKSMLEIIHHLPQKTQSLYKSATGKQIKDRLSTKLSWLLSLSDKDIKHTEIQVHCIYVISDLTYFPKD